MAPRLSSRFPPGRLRQARGAGESGLLPGLHSHPKNRKVGNASGIPPTSRPRLFLAYFLANLRNGSLASSNVPDIA